MTSKAAIISISSALTRYNRLRRQVYVKRIVAMADFSTVSTPMSLRFNVILLDWTVCVSLATGSCVSRIVHVQEITALLDVVGSAKKNVDFFEGDFSSLWDEEPDEDCEEDVYASEKPERVARGSQISSRAYFVHFGELKNLQSFFVEEYWEELLEDHVGDVLHLTGHADCLCSDVH